MGESHDPYGTLLSAITLPEGDWMEVRQAVLAAAKGGTDPRAFKFLALELASTYELINRQAARLESAPAVAR